VVTGSPASCAYQKVYRTLQDVKFKSDTRPVHTSDARMTATPHAQVAGPTHIAQGLSPLASEGENLKVQCRARANQRT